MNLRELDRLYVQAPDPGQGSFEQKLRIQIGMGTPQAIQLMAEILFVYYLPVHGGVAGTTKRQRIGEVLSWSSSPVDLPPDLADVLDSGIGGGGVGLNTFKWSSVSYLIRFGMIWKATSAQLREDALADPWKFLEFASQEPTTGGGTFAKEALLHLVHPDTFERVFSRSEKWSIAQRFSTLVDGEPPEVDRRIWQIRERLAVRFGEDFDFYDSIPVVAMWKPEVARWSSFLYWAGRYRDEPDFDAQERDYKLALVDALTPAKQAILAGESGWFEPFEAALRGRDNNLIGWRETDRLIKWGQAEQEIRKEESHK